jgi:hypothetical protein
MFYSNSKKEMKSFRFGLKDVAVTLACLAVGFLLFTGCEKDDPALDEVTGTAEAGKTYVSTTPDGEKVYMLKVSKNLLKSSAAPTDTYVLLYVDKSGEVKTSAGMVTSSVGDVLTLTPTGGTPFSVTVTANGITGISGNIAFTDGSTATGGNLMPFANGEIEITGAAITEDRVLGVPGMAINYVYNGNSLLAINANKTLTVLPGTTIRFTQAGGGIGAGNVGATIKMLGEDKLRELDAAGNLSITPGTQSGHITLKGGTAKGSWRGFQIEGTTAENQLQYVDILNAGAAMPDGSDGAISMWSNTKLGITNSSISGSMGNGIYLANGDITITAFSNNTITGCDQNPVYVQDIYSVEKFDATSNLTGNGTDYIRVTSGDIRDKNLTLNATTVPYYVNGIDVTGGRTLTINKGTTIFIGSNRGFYITDGAHLVVNGGTGAGEKVTFTHLPGSTYYWQGFEFFDSYGNVFKNAVIEYGGSPNNDANINAYYRSEVTLENVEIKNSKKYGVSMYYNNGSDESTVKGTAIFSGNIAGNIFDATTQTLMQVLP